MTSLSRILRIAAGCLMMVLGVIGLFVPVLQGLLFLAIGAALLAPDVPFFHRLLVGLRRRYPRLRSPMKRFGIPWRKKKAQPPNSDKLDSR